MATTVFEKPVSTEITTLAEQIATYAKHTTYTGTTTTNSDGLVDLTGLLSIPAGATIIGITVLSKTWTVWSGQPTLFSNNSHYYSYFYNAGNMSRYTSSSVDVVITAFYTI